MSYEKFIPLKKGGAAPKPPAAKILKGGQVSLNSAAYEQYLKGATHIELYYDPSSKKIGLQPKKYKTKATFKLNAVGKNKSTYRINAKPLIEHYGIKLSEKVSATLAWNSNQNLLELSL